MREAAGDEPKAVLACAGIHVAQFLPVAETPDRADARGDVFAEQSLHQDFLRLVSGRKHDEVAGRVGPIWGFGEAQELRNLFIRTAQPGLWFIAGSLAQCRINSKFLALQIKAIEEGLLPRTSE